MRAFESFDLSTLLEGELVLMTVHSLDNPKAKMSVADFRDSEALFVAKAGRWVGMSASRGLRFGTGPLRLADGVWRCMEDVGSQSGFEDLKLTASVLSLETIR